MRFDPTRPFLLIDDARPGRGARLFADPAEIITVRDLGAVRPALQKLATATRAGHWAAGFLAFEAGYALEARLAALARLPDDGLPLLWFALFDRPQLLESQEVNELLGDHPARTGPVVPDIDEPTHAAMVARLHADIAAGDIYQANLTFSAHVAAEGHPLGLYRRLRAAQAAPHGALIHTGDAWALSLSPELFFSLEKGRLVTRPMKGTAPRAPTSAEDRAAAAALAADPKNRAENLMIVDLLRNDLSRVAEPGSVTTEALFTVESYPTVHQMTSSITARLQPECGPVDVIEALFPCGSVTGAPKIRAMEIIAEVEQRPRGLYTGSIGWISPTGDATFNVAIRTLTLPKGTPVQARLGLGSAIVADSRAASEWQECRTKSAFVTRDARPFDLIETLGYTADAGLLRLDRHLDRLAASAAYWNFTFDRDAARTLLDDAVAAVTADARVRLLLSQSGALSVQVAPLTPPPDEPVAVAAVPCPRAPDDPRLFHKTTDRQVLDAARAAAGAFEVVFVDADGLLSEGSFTNLFVPRDGRLLTPPLARGLLPGILRAELLESGRAAEADLRLTDLRDGFFIGNSLRGLIAARLC